jgi:hypothetical protein
VRRGWQTVVATAVVLVMVAPALRSDAPDGFPLSTYPMFTADRGREVELATAVGVEGDGTVVRLDPGTIADTDEVMLASATVGRAVGLGSDARLCAEIADRLKDGTPGTVEVRTETYDSVEYLAGDTEPLAVEVHTRCEVPR